MKGTIHVIKAAILLSLPLFVISFFITYFLTDSMNTLGFVLFVVGSIPIVLYMPSLFSQSSSGALHTPKVIYRLVGASEHNRKASIHKKATLQATLSILIAGAILWLISLLIQL